MPQTAHRPQPFDDDKEAWSAYDSGHQQHSAPSHPQHHHEQHARREKRKFKHSSQAGTYVTIIHVYIHMYIMYVLIVFVWSHLQYVILCCIIEGNRAQLQRYKEFCEMLFDQCDTGEASVIA